MSDGDLLKNGFASMAERARAALVELVAKAPQAHAEIDELAKFFTNALTMYTDSLNIMIAKLEETKTDLAAASERLRAIKPSEN